MLARKRNLSRVLIPNGKILAQHGMIQKNLSYLKNSTSNFYADGLKFTP